MENLFIKEIEITKVRNIEAFNIPLTDEKSNLIITGRNGSGKTTVLQALKEHLNMFSTHHYRHYEHHLRERSSFEENINKAALLATDSKEYENAIKVASIYEKRMKPYGGIELKLTDGPLINEKYSKGEFIFAYFPAKRNAQLIEPAGISKIPMQTVYHIDDNIGAQFIQFLVNMKADRSFAKDENDEESVKKIDDWFETFESNLFQLFDAKNMKLVFNRKNYNFDIIEEGKEPYNLNQLSDGYAAVLSIVTELIMRMEEPHDKSYGLEGIVLIDEIETHLHIELQKRVLPFLTSLFSRVQFIVTTHSPFVINSINSAVVCDLERKIVTTDLSGYFHSNQV